MMSAILDRDSELRCQQINHGSRALDLVGIKEGHVFADAWFALPCGHQFSVRFQRRPLNRRRPKLVPSTSLATGSSKST